MKKILVTGAKGFIGKNLVVSLSRRHDLEVASVDIDTLAPDLDRALDVCEVVFHLAGVNRPARDEEFESGNVGSLASVLDKLRDRRRSVMVVLSSSTQAECENPYGKSKHLSEKLLIDRAVADGFPARIFRLPGVFGKWCRPNYNSVVATFCHNMARGLGIQVNDPAHELELVHIDDVVSAFSKLLEMPAPSYGAEFLEVSPVYRITVGRLADSIREISDSRRGLHWLDLSDPFLRKLYSTFFSYLPSGDFTVEPEAKADSRGELTELMKSISHGQLFVSRTRPGVTRGNHYHDQKVEKFIILEGEAVIRFRNLSNGESVQYPVSGGRVRIVDIPPGWTHSIENIGQHDLLTLFWSSDIFDPTRPGTYPAEVVK